MKSTIISVILVLSLICLAGCGSSGGAKEEAGGGLPGPAAGVQDPPAGGQPAADPDPAPADPDPTPEGVYKVSDLEGFIKAIGTGHTIIIEGGVAIPGHAPEKEGKETLLDDYGNPYVDWYNTYDGYNLTITGVSNLTIKGGGGGRSPLTNKSLMTSVLAFVDCTDITLENLSVGHEPPMEEGDGCAEVVFAFDYCSDITIRNTGIYGCGTHGMWLYVVDGVMVENSEIYECSQGLLMVDYSSNVTFRNVKFRDTFSYYGDQIRVSDSENMMFDKCTFRDNVIGGDGYYDFGFFYVIDSKDVLVRGCDFTNNASCMLADVVDNYGDWTSSPPIRFVGCSFDDNVFESYGELWDGVWVDFEWHSGEYDDDYYDDWEWDGIASYDDDELTEYLLWHVDKAYDLVNYDGKTVEIVEGEAEEINGDVCRLLLLGEYHEGDFMPEIFYAISLYGDIYEYDVEYDEWEMVY
jgi:hypothetical protein